jgi:signal transduction histidine kinase
MNDLLFGIPFTAFVMNIFMIAYVNGHRQRDAVNRAFVLFVGTGTAMILFWATLSFTFGQGNEMIIGRICTFLWLPLGFLLLNFSYALVGKARDAVYWVALAAAGIVVTLGVSTDLVMAGFERLDFGLVDVRGPLYEVVAMVPVSSFAYGVWLITRAFARERDPNRRNIFRTIIIGCVLTLITSFVASVVLSVHFGIKVAIPFGPSMITFFSFFIYWAVNRNNFLTVSADQVAELIFDRLGDGVILADESGRIGRVNVTAERMLGVEPGGAVGRRMEEVLPGIDVTSGAKPLEITVGGRSDQRVLSLSRTTIRRADESSVALILVRDVTEERRLQERLEASRDQLARDVERRTAELGRVQKLETLGTLAGGVAHDFSNLIGAILGFITAARDDQPEAAPFNEDLDEIYEATLRARSIVQQILFFSRRGERKLVETKLVDTLADSVMILKASLPSTIDIRVDLPRGEHRFIGDAGQIKQIVVNLCANAYYAMREEGGELTVSAVVEPLDADLVSVHEMREAESYARIDVRDTGEGMHEETLKSIFNPFFSTRNTGEGSGLGLSTALGIAKTHGGTITVESRPGEGTTFHVYLPLL